MEIERGGRNFIARVVAKLVPCIMQAAFNSPAEMPDPQSLRTSFESLYARDPRVFSAPGRVNLIGEHTDYNEGFVLPMAANLRTYAAAAPRDDRVVQVHSFDLNEAAAFELDEKDRSPHPKPWVRYVQGVAHVLEDRGCRLRGADIAISSQVPIGAGLSSSAALELSVGYALLKLSNEDVDLVTLVLAAQHAEHTFVGTRSGLMDQLTAAFGRQGHAVFIDCRSLERNLIPMNIGGTRVVVCDTHVKHELATSAYNQRRRECERAVEMLSEQRPGIKALRDLNVSDLDLIASLPEPLRRRAKHVVTENDRTQRAAGFLQQGDAAALGELINASHASLRDDYEVSCRELDIMVELARSQPGVFGARMMGGGFGGCTVNLVEADSVPRFKETITSGYSGATGIKPAIHVIESDDGVGELRD